MKIEAIAYQTRGGQYFPAFKYPDGRIETFSPSSFDESRALQIAQQILGKHQFNQMKTDELHDTADQSALLNTHADEPWQIEAHQKNRLKDSNGLTIAVFYDDQCGDANDNAARALSCVNACAGLPDPAKALQTAREALENAIERMEAVADGILVEKRHEGVSQATHVRHMAGHLAQHAKIARAALKLLGEKV